MLGDIRTVREALVSPFLKRGKLLTAQKCCMIEYLILGFIDVFKNVLTGHALKPQVSSLFTSFLDGLKKFYITKVRES